MTKSVNYSYPVLGNLDSIEGDFRFELEIERDENRNFIFSISVLDIGNDEIMQWIEDRKCRVVVEISCSSTFYSSNHEVLSVSRWEISENSLVNECEAQFFILTNCDVDYSLVSFLGPYKGLNFNLKENTVIGRSMSLKWPVPIVYSDKSEFELFQFVEQQEVDGSLALDLTGQSFVIFYPRFEGVSNPIALLMRSKPYSIYRSMFIPILMDAIVACSAKSEGADLHEGKYWYLFLRNAVGGDFDAATPLELAQRVFSDYTFEQCFKELAK